MSELLKMQPGFAILQNGLNNGVGSDSSVSSVKCCHNSGESIALIHIQILLHIPRLLIEFLSMIFRNGLIRYKKIEILRDVSIEGIRNFQCPHMSIQKNLNCF